jgi:hypothetical protein
MKNVGRSGGPHGALPVELSPVADAVARIGTRLSLSMLAATQQGRQSQRGPMFGAPRFEPTTGPLLPVTLSAS